MGEFWILGLVLLLLLWSAVKPKDRFTWLLELRQVLIGIPLLWANSPSFPLTPITYQLLTIHAVILIGAVTSQLIFQAIHDRQLAHMR